jgi:hypothetical protein
MILGDYRMSAPGSTMLVEMLSTSMLPGITVPAALPAVSLPLLLLSDVGSVNTNRLLCGGRRGLAITICVLP